MFAPDGTLLGKDGRCRSPLSLENVRLGQDGEYMVLIDGDGTATFGYTLTLTRS